MIKTFLESKESQKALYKAYVRILDRICHAVGINTDNIVVSQLGISIVLNEVQSDLIALQMRRSFPHGISKGKIAGSLAFRLCKTPVISMTPEIAELQIAQKLTVDVAVALAFELVGTNFEIWPMSLVREIKYFLAKRHSNQESLGICFDTIACSKPVQTIDSSIARCD